MRVGAICPSTDSLADLITSEIDATRAPVLELGAGTGVFTDALMRRGIREHELILIEAEPRLAQHLKHRFPNAMVICMDAAQLLSRLNGYAGAVGAVVSGLPLRNFTAAHVYAILTQALELLRPDAALYQFTYGLRSPIDVATLCALHLDAKRIGNTWRNFPPAAVYRFRRRVDESQCLSGA